MNLKHIILGLSLSQSILMPQALEGKTKGTFLITPEEFEMPSFPKITLINELNNDSTVYLGNFMGQINYDLPKGTYLLKVEPGYDLITKIKGDDFKPYTSKVTIPSKKLTEIRRE